MSTMDNKARIEKIKEHEYQELFGVYKPTFDNMHAILEDILLVTDKGPKVLSRFVLSI